MSRKSTPLLTFIDIKTDSIDLVADAFGYEYQYPSFIRLLSSVEVEPGSECISILLQRAAIQKK